MRLRAECPSRRNRRRDAFCKENFPLARLPGIERGVQYGPRDDFHQVRLFFEELSQWRKARRVHHSASQQDGRIQARGNSEARQCEGEEEESVLRKSEDVGFSEERPVDGHLIEVVVVHGNQRQAPWNAK